MDNNTIQYKQELRQRLLSDVAYLCTRDDLTWVSPIVKFLLIIREYGLKAVFFGGTLRSLIMNRILNKRGIGRPRDIDIVVSDINIGELRKVFRAFIIKETRFGGLHLQNEFWQYDIWPLNSTWSFINSNIHNPSFYDLPKTTFLNIESIAVDVWSKPGLARTIYENELFYDSIINRKIEINNIDNPYPSLCVIRSLVMIKKTGFSIGNRLKDYLIEYGSIMSDTDIINTQMKHYGSLNINVEDFKRYIKSITRHRNTNSTISLKESLCNKCDMRANNNVYVQR